MSSAVPVAFAGACPDNTLTSVSAALPQVAIRGKGSVKEGAARDGKYDHGEDEPLHVQIVGDSQEQVDAAAEQIAPMLRPGTDEFETIKQRQLHELALINGTVKETDYCQVCGKPGHLMHNCPVRACAHPLTEDWV